MATWDPIVVTGACGFVGANLCRQLLARGVKVVAVVGPSGRAWRLPEHPSLSQESVDLARQDAVNAFIKRVAPRAVVHCAAFGAYPSQTDQDRIYQVNLAAVRYLIEALREVGSSRAFIQMGSSSEYGTRCSAPKESDLPEPDSHYAVAKLAATALVQHYARKHGFRGFVLRLYSIYGPREDSSRLIPQLLLRAREGKLPPLVNPRISRDFVYVDDVGRVVEAVLERAERLTPGSVYNVGSGKCTTLGDLVTLARQTFGIAEEPKWGSMADRAWDHPDWYADPRKAELELGWKATTSLEAGLRQTYDWLAQDAKGAEEALRNSVLAGGRG